MHGYFCSVFCFIVAIEKRSWNYLFHGCLTVLVIVQQQEQKIKITFKKIPTLIIFFFLFWRKKGIKGNEKPFMFLWNAMPYTSKNVVKIFTSSWFTLEDWLMEYLKKSCSCLENQLYWNELKIKFCHKNNNEILFFMLCFV